MRTCGLSHQIKGPVIVNLTILQLKPVLANFTVVGPLIWCDNPHVRMSKILYINNNDFHNLGRSQMCAGAFYVFRTSKPHSRTLWAVPQTPSRVMIRAFLAAGAHSQPPSPHRQQTRGSGRHNWQPTLFSVEKWLILQFIGVLNCYQHKNCNTAIFRQFRPFLSPRKLVIILPRLLLSPLRSDLCSSSLEWK